MNLTLYIPPVWKKTNFEDKMVTSWKWKIYKGPVLQIFGKNKFITKKITGNRIEVK